MSEINLSFIGFESSFQMNSFGKEKKRFSFQQKEEKKSRRRFAGMAKNDDFYRIKDGKGKTNKNTNFNLTDGKSPNF